ncbi:hypothetical protein GCM10007301_01080 [Azorhizobium oxalatiphilum]|uniref:Uncharacterized protein n=1 Tax=Azorhizobium oxalatiphilum TaxID=980631 RepID=A0A917F229_9HYPH|nr:hypothetical protein [Azorhizobium oxalatiphilum]GGF45328.1 hypothetical protein GCM10007301_01080 [Azorhizobium oxalatiphilum]
MACRAGSAFLTPTPDPARRVLLAWSFPDDPLPGDPALPIQPRCIGTGDPSLTAAPTMSRSAHPFRLPALCSVLTHMWAGVLVAGTVAFAGGIVSGDITLTPAAGSTSSGSHAADLLGSGFVTRARAETLGASALDTDPPRSAARGASRLMVADPLDTAPRRTAIPSTDDLALPSAYSRPDDSAQDLARPDPGEAPESGRPRAHGVYAPYLANPQVGDGDLDPKALKGSLEARGFTDLSRPILRGRTYICEATGPRRERVRLLVDADSGVIVGLTVLGYDNRSSVSTP